MENALSYTWSSEKVQKCPNKDMEKQQICWIKNILENISFLKSDIGYKYLLIHYTFVWSCQKY